MLSILQPYFNIENFGSKSTKLNRKQNKPKYMHRDDLDKKIKSPNKLKKIAEEAKVPLLRKEKELERESHSGEEREGIKVKILMTKEEAARLLSKCKDGGVLEFRDVARELVHIPASRVISVVSSATGEDRVLGSIPEES